MRLRSTSHQTATSGQHVLRPGTEGRHALRPRAEGFTLIEVVVAVAILVLVLALGLFISLDVYRGYAYRSERATIVSLLTRARAHAMANVNQAPWGLCKDTASGSYKLFRGAGYAANAYVDESVPAGGATQVTGLPACTAGAGIVFSQLAGTTSPVTIQVQQTTGMSTITINDEGTVLW